MRAVFDMDNIAHTLTGLVVRDAAPKRLFGSKAFLWASLLIANAPDIDICLMPFGMATYLKYHRGITHSLFSVPIWGLIGAILALYLSRKKLPFLLSWLWLSIIVILHIAVDWITTYGTELFAPFSHITYSANLFPIFDPWFILILSLTSIAVSRIKRFSRKIVIFIGIIAMLFYSGTRVYCKYSSEHLVDSRFGPVAEIFSFPNIENIGAWLNPTKFRIVTVSGEMASSYDVSPLTGRTDFQRTTYIFSKGDEFWEEVDSYELGRVFVERSSLPIIYVGDDFLALSDLRYSATAGQNGGLTLYFEMNDGRISGPPSFDKPH